MKTWTTKELAYLKKHSLLAETNEVLNITEMAKKLNRTTQSVRNKLYSMQRSGDMPAVDRSMQRDAGGRFYSPEEDKRIISMYKQGATYREISDSLGRTETSVTGRVYNLRKSGRLKTKKLKRWTEKETQLLIARVRFDETGHVNNYEELMRLVSKNYHQLTGKITKLRKAGKISTSVQPGTTSKKSKQAMKKFNDARFAHVPKNKEEKTMSLDSHETVPQDIPQAISIESREITLILTTTTINGHKVQQFFTKDGELLATKKLTPVAPEISK
ncbi:hypothetical protein IGI67_005220 [Enterococcus sp. AZ196]